MVKLRVVASGLSMVAALAAPPAQAEWKGQGELGLVLARGNTNTETVNAKADLTTEVDPWKHTVGFSALRSTNEDELTGDRYELHGQSDYKLSAQSYAFGSLRYENDHFSSFTYQAVAAAGYGYKFFDTEVTKLSADVGAGYRKSKVRETGETLNNVIFRGGLNYAHKLTSNTDIYDKALVESGKDNTFAQNELGIKVAMNASLALSLAHQLRYNSDVIAPKKHIDQLLTANLVFSF